MTVKELEKMYAELNARVENIEEILIFLSEKKEQSQKPVVFGPGAKGYYGQVGFIDGDEQAARDRAAEFFRKAKLGGKRGK